jgi:hypothetical protein
MVDLLDRAPGCVDRAASGFAQPVHSPESPWRCLLMEIGEPKEIREVEPLEVPIPEVMPEVVPEPIPEPAREPEPVRR